jgi:hypothetical protein
MGQNLSILLYSSPKKASVGDIVEINIRNNVDYGLILSENVEEGIKCVTATTVSPMRSDEGLKNGSSRSAQDDSATKSEVNVKKFEIKEINKILPIKLSHEQIQFLKIFSDNTFNSLNDTWDAIVQPYNLLTQKQWKELDQISNSRSKENTKQSVDDVSDANTLSKENQKAQNDTFIEVKNSELVAKSEVLLNKPKIAPKVEFLIDFNIIVRIMYIIRSLTCMIKEDQIALKQGINRQLLIVFPEKKYLNKVYKSIVSELSKSKELGEIVEILYYAGESTKKPKECIWSMLNFENEINTNVTASTMSPNETQNTSNPPDRIFRCAQDDGHIIDPNFIDNSIIPNQTSQNVNTRNQTPRLQIILSTRSGLFLPFTALNDIILVDEGNSMYIQDQNSLYYDTREAIFLISKAFNANISFISTLPSIRLYNMYNKEALEQQLINNQAIAQKPRRIKITRYDKKSSKYDLFGYEIEQMLDGM